MSVPKHEFVFVPQALREEFLAKTQAMMAGCMIGDPGTVRTSRRFLYELVEHADARGLHDLLSCVCTMLDRAMAENDAKEGLRGFGV